MRTDLVLIIGIFLMIFSVDGILFSDSILPECTGFTGMGWFVLISKPFGAVTVLPNHECFSAFCVQTVSGVLFIVGLALIVHLMIKRKKNQLNGGLIGK